MLLGLITDLHFGARNDSQLFHKHFARFYNEIFLPYLKEHNIDTVIDLGDTFDRRKYINYVSLKEAKECLFKKLYEEKIDTHIIIGNHDVPYKSTNRVNSPSLLLKEYDNLTIYEEAEDVVFDGTTITMMPWINNENYQRSMEHIQTTPSDLLFGHLELRGFEMYRGAVNELGLSGELFSKFDKVFTGHFHHKSTQGNLSYLGAPYEITWSDYKDPRGFHVFDTETRELTYIQNPLRMFHKIYYDDSKGDQNKIISYSKEDLKTLKDTYVKVIITDKNNPYWFDMFIDELERIGVADIQVVEDHLNLSLEDESDIINEAESTPEIIKQYIGNMNFDKKKDLETLFFKLYNDVITNENL